MKVKQMIIAIILTIIGIIIDQSTKLLAFKYEEQLTNKTVLGLKFVIHTNDGIAWGHLGGKRWLLIIITILALGFFTYLLKDFNLVENPIYSASLILVISGTLGNFIDRIFLGEVRDFITFSFLNNFPSFNFADMCLTVGVIFLAIDILFGETGVRWTK